MSTLTHPPSDVSDWRHLPLAEMEKRVARFDQAVWAAQLAAPPTHDLLKKAVRREHAARCPVWLRRVTLDVVIRYGEALNDTADVHQHYARFDAPVTDTEPGPR